MEVEILAMKRFLTPQLGLVLSVFLVSSLLTIWHYDFDRLGSVPFGIRATAFSIFFSHTVRIDGYWEAAGVDYAWNAGHYYSGYPPLVATVTAVSLGIEQVGVFAYTKVVGQINGHIAWLLESWFIALPQILSLCGLTWLLFKLLRYFKVGFKTSFFASWCLPFTSYALVYSIGANNDLPVAFLVFAGFYLLTTSGDSFTKKRLFFSGLVTSLAVLAAYPAILFVFVWSLTIVLTDKRNWLRNLFFYLLGAGFPVLLLGLYHTYAFGAPWRFAHNFHATKVAPGQTAANKVDFSLLNIPTGLRGLLISPLKGLFIYAPLVLFSLFGVKSFLRKQRNIAIATILGIISVILFYSIWWDWSGGFDFASRYLLSTLPFFYLFLGFGLSKIFKNIFLKSLFFIVVVWSLVTTLIFSFTGVREAIVMSRWGQWGALGRFESFFKVFLQNNPKDVAPMLVRFSQELPLLNSLSFGVVSLLLIALVLLIAIFPLFNPFLRKTSVSS